MGTLTVANLLPADLDPESLSIANLQVLLDRVQAENQQVRASLFTHLQQDLNSTAGWQGMQSLNLSALTLPEGSVEGQAITYIKQVIELQNQVRNVEAKIAVANTLHDLESQVQDFSAHIAAGRYREAAWGYLQLKKISEDGKAGVKDAGAGHLPAGMNNIDAMLEWCGTTLAQQLKEDCAALVQASSEHRYLSVRVLTSRGASLGELWGTLSLMQQLELHMQPLAEALVSQIVSPILQAICTVAVHHYDATPSEQDGTDEGPVAVLQWMPGTTVVQQREQQPTTVPLGPHDAHSALAACSLMLDFFTYSLCGQESEALQVFGSLFWPQFVVAYTKSLVHPLLSHTEPATEAVDQLLAASVQLEEHAATLGLIPASNSSLSAAVDSLIKGSVHDRRQKYLARARQLLADRHETVEVGFPVSRETLIFLNMGGEGAQDGLIDGLGPSAPSSGPVLSFGYYHIPGGVHQLVELINEGLLEASSSGSEAAAKAIHSAVEGVLVLVQQLVQKQCVADGPGQLMIIQCNGLQHLAQHLMMMPLTGVKGWEQLPAHSWSFPSQLLGLRQLHTQLLTSLISAEVASMLELLSPLLQPWRSTSVQADITRRKAVSQVSHSLARLGKALLAVAPVHVLVRIAAGVLSGLGSQLVDHVLDRHSIGAEESTQLGSYLNTLMEDGLKGLLQAGQPLSSQLQRSGVSVACVREAILHGAVSFRRLRCISAMLDAKLVQIVEWWEEGRLTAAGLQPGEVHHLVRALFEDNDHRRKCLAMIGH